MASVQQQVQNADGNICQNIANNGHDRGFLSQNLLAQLRNLIEGLIVWAALKDPSAEFHYNQVSPAIDSIRPQAKFRLLTRFHKLLQASTSHYTLDGDPSERLMLKYYEFLLRTRDLTSQQFGTAILGNLEAFPVDLDPSLREYHQKIGAQIDAVRSTAYESRRERYYIHSSRPFFTNGRIYYEVTFSAAHNSTSKFDRTIAFTDIELTDKYAAYLDLSSEAITVLGRTMPISIIRSWEVSIRPCEFDHFGRFFGHTTRVKSAHVEYRSLMEYLTTTRSSLLDLVDMTDSSYNQTRITILQNLKREAVILPVIDQARSHIRASKTGARVLRYLLLQMRNQWIKNQYQSLPNGWMGGLRMTSSSKPFDTMPFCTSPRGHVPRFADLAECFDTTGRKHELLARRVRNNVEQHGAIYTSAAECEDLGDVPALIETHNRLLPPTANHEPRKLKHANGHVFIVGYENDAVAIIEKLQAIAGVGIEGHAESVQQWLDDNPTVVDDELKAEALKALFVNSKVALLYGAAGTGKSTMVNHIASYFSAERKLFLAHTNPAVDNLKQRVHAENSEFSTVTKHRNSSSGIKPHYDVVVIDECSTLSNAGLLAVLEKTDFELLVLVGDVYQIESIEFGNWFSLVRAYVPPDSVFELTTPWRTEDTALLSLWDRVRNLDDRIEESLAKNGYSKTLGEELFQRDSDDEIVLCLNYDGLYGINNVNRFLQASNAREAVSWGEAIYKPGDPVLFNENDRFRPIIVNNLKGTIVAIDRAPGRITFDIDLQREIDGGELQWSSLRWQGGSVVQFDVYERGDSDDDDDDVNTLVPFQIAYAVSIHKAQGLEYDSVKVVVTDANEERISHSIFYTAITRSRRRLGIFWTAETEKRILSKLAVRENAKDEILLKVRRGVTPLGKRPRRQKSRNPAG